MTTVASTANERREFSEFTGMLVEDEKEEFLQAATSGFLDAIDELAVLDRNRSRDLSERRESLRATWWRWMRMAALSSDWNGAVRVVDLVREQLVSCRLDLQDPESLEAFESFLSSGPERFPHAVEHFVNSGELLELAHLMRKKFTATYRPPSRYPVFDMGEAGRVWTSIWNAVMVLWVFDQESCIDLDEVDGAEGDDENTVNRLPLEVRAGLVGFFDEVESRDI